eukprot:13238701-Heterocapsa_arctica.AAC.1
MVLGNDINQTHEDTRIIDTGKWADAWFIDDGQIFSRPGQVDGILQDLDARLQQSGATRGSLRNGNDIKSTVRTFGREEEYTYSQ